MYLGRFLWLWGVPGLGFGRISMDLEGPRPWIWKDFDGFGGSQALDLKGFRFGESQALDLEGFRWIWRVPGLGFERISLDVGGPRPLI